MADKDGENNENGENMSFLQKISNVFPYLPQIAMCIVGVFAILAVVLFIYGGELSTIGDGGSNVARGLITLLVAIVTVAIAIMLTLSVLLSNSTDYEKRFALGKEILTIFIGVLGTIVGFYFGSAPIDKGLANPNNSNVSVNANVNTANLNTANNGNSNSNSNSAQTQKQKAVDYEKTGFNAIDFFPSDFLLSRVGL